MLGRGCAGGLVWSCKGLFGMRGRRVVFLNLRNMEEQGISYG